MSRDSVVSRIVHANCDREPTHRADGATPWWEALDEDFYARDEPFELALRDRVSVGATAVGDVVLRTLGASLVGALALPLGYHPARVAGLRRDADFYMALADRACLEDVFVAPDGPVEVHARRPWQPTFRPRDGSVRDLTFDSAFEPLNPHQRGDYLRHRANRTAHARYWRHDDGPRPTIIAIHGFSADLYFINQWFFAIPWLYELGCDVLLFTLPFHGPRQTRFSPFSGHGFFAGGVQRINEAMVHAVHDLRAFIDWLEHNHGVTEVGVTGVSLGGFTASLLASVEPRLRFAIPNVPVTSIADLVLEWEPIGTALRGMMRLAGLSLTDARHMLAIGCPLTWPAALPTERLMIIAGVGDRLAPPKHSRLLWEHWQRCRMHWFPGSHLLHLDKGAYFGEMARFMAGLGFIEPRETTAR